MKNIVKFIIPLILVIAIPLILFIQKKENNIQQFDQVTQKVFDQFHPTGLSVVIVQDGEIIFSKNLGYANTSKMDFLNGKDIFNIASCTKAFTAAAIGKLVEDSLLAWNDKVVDYIPEFRLKDPYITQHLTLKDILSHRSGFSTFDGDLLWYNTSYTNDEVIDRMQYLPVPYDFRTRFGYQNNMFMLAGEIVKKVTGQSWENYIHETFMVPLEMNDTRTSNDQFDGTENIAYPHFKDSVIGIYDFEASKPAASIWSNTLDLSHWVMMWLNDGKWKEQQILDPKTIRTLQSPQTILPVSEQRESWGTHFRSYALGWSTYDYNGVKIVEHNGGMPGYISKVALIPEKNLGVVILNNGFDVYGNDALFYSIVDIVNEKPVNNWVEYYLTQKEESKQRDREFNEQRLLSRDTTIAPTLALEKFTGIYKDIMYGNAKIELDNAKLKITLLPAKEVFFSTMEHWNKNSFKIVFDDPFLPYGLVTFETTDKNEVTGFKIDLPSHDFHFKNLDFKKID
ncbi:MAG: serine hydrolase [Bacteroidetes bacterium]|nr:serine hydrolase [Bacteroidota bacterium]